MPLLLTNQCPPSFHIKATNLRIPNYQLYAVEKWILQRRHTTLLVVYTGNPEHTVLLDACESDDEQVWETTIALFRANGARPRQTAEGVLMVTSLAHFRSDYTIVQIPGGDFRQVRDQLYANINLLRTGCSGRTALTLEDPSESTKERFISLYHLPDPAPPTSVDHLPLGSTSSLSRKDTRTRETFVSTVLELFKLVQAGLALFGLPNTTTVAPNVVFDGLLCDDTVRGIQQWTSHIGGPCVGLQATQRTADPLFIAALLSLVLSIRNKVAYLGYAHLLPRDPFLYPYAFALAITSYVQNNHPPVPGPLPQTLASPHHATHVSVSSFIPAAPPPSNFYSAAAAAAAVVSTTSTLPVGAVLTRELVQSIFAAHDAKLKAENRKVRRVIKNKLAPVDSDGDATSEQQRRTLALGGSEGPSTNDRSPAQAASASAATSTTGGGNAGGSGPTGAGSSASAIGSSGGQILTGIGNLVLGSISSADGSIIVPTLDLTSFVSTVMRSSGLGSASHHHHPISRRERKKRDRHSLGLRAAGESLDLSASIGGAGSIGYFYERERDAGAIGGTVRALWSGRVGDLVRMREEAEGNGGLGGGGPTWVSTPVHKRSRSIDGSKWPKRLSGQVRPPGASRQSSVSSRVPTGSGVASDGDANESNQQPQQQTYDGRSTEEESDVFNPTQGNLNMYPSSSFGGMWKGKLGSWAGLAKRSGGGKQSVDMSLAKEKEKNLSIPYGQGSIPSRQSKMNISIDTTNNTFVGAGRRPSVSRAQTAAGAQSPTLPPMMYNPDAEDDDLLSSGQVSPQSDYRPNPFNMLGTQDLTNKYKASLIGTGSADASSTNLPLAQDARLTKLLGQKRRAPSGGRIASWADPISAKEDDSEETEEEEEEEEEEQYKGGLSDSAAVFLRKKRKHMGKTRFHSLMSVLDGAGVLMEEPLEESDESEDEQLSTFDLRRRRSFHDLDSLRGMQVLSPERMKIDVDLCGHLLIMSRRREHVQNVITAAQLISASLGRTNAHLHAHYTMHAPGVEEINSATAVIAEADAARRRSLGILQATNTLEYESAQFLVEDELWHAVRPARHKVFELREKIFGSGSGGGGGSRRLAQGVHGAHGAFDRLQWTLDGEARLVDHLGRTESEAEEEAMFSGEQQTPVVENVKDDDTKEEEGVEHPAMKPMWLLRFFTSWGARWSASSIQETT